MNSGYPAWPVNAAVRAQYEWARSGELPTQADRLELADEGFAFRVDDLGNAPRRLRTPYVEVWWPYCRVSARVTMSEAAGLHWDQAPP
jgi:hypothetical protein